jgi:hypothetical protein
MRRIWLVCSLVGLFVLSVASVAGQGGAPLVEFAGPLPGALNTKFPRVAVSGGQAHVAANSQLLHATYWNAPTEGAFGAPELLGTAEGQPDYSSAAITSGPDGTIYVVWINQPERAIYLRSRPPGGAWSEPRLVMSGSPFPVHVAITAGSEGIFVAWRDPDQPFTFRYSTDGGLTWSRTLRMAYDAGYNMPSLASGAGKVAIAYTQGYADQLQIFVGLWNGQNFGMQMITTPNSSYADPGIAISSSGRIVAAWRGIADNGPLSGVFLAEQSANGMWPIQQVISGKVIGPVTPAFDDAGGLHLFWIGEVGGSLRLWYAYQQPDGAWSAPVGSDVPGGGLFNAHGAVGAAQNGLIYGHAVSELFLGDRLSAHTFRFATNSVALPYAIPSLQMNGTNNLHLDFHTISGEPSELRWRWNEPPSDADPWQPFSALDLPLPVQPATQDCQQLQLFTQVRSNRGMQPQAQSAVIALDNDIQASVKVHNPGGADGYTRRTFIRLEIDASDECSPLTEAAIGDQVWTMGDGPIHQLLIPLISSEPEQNFTLRLSDSLGNQRSYAMQAFFDREAPQYEGGNLQVITDPAFSSLQTIVLKDLTYRDATSVRPWAIQLRVKPPESDLFPSYREQTIPLEEMRVTRSGDGTLTITAPISLHSVFQPVTSGLRSGTYTFEVTLLDFAGNPTEIVASEAITLTDIRAPQFYLPLVQ